MFWTNNNDNTPSIRAADMGGKNVYTVVNTDIKSPGGLAIDTTRKRLYWTDTTLNKIQFVDFSGEKWLQVQTIIKAFSDDMSGLVVRVWPFTSRPSSIPTRVICELSCFHATRVLFRFLSVLLPHEKTNTVSLECAVSVDEGGITSVRELQCPIVIPLGVTRKECKKGTTHYL